MEMKAYAASDVILLNILSHITEVAYGRLKEDELKIDSEEWATLVNKQNCKEENQKAKKHPPEDKEEE